MLLLIFFVMIIQSKVKDAMTSHKFIDRTNANEVTCLRSRVKCVALLFFLLLTPGASVLVFNYVTLCLYTKSVEVEGKGKPRLRKSDRFRVSINL